MDPKYEPFFRQIDNNLKFRIHDTLDDHDHPTAKALQEDVRDMLSDLRTNKHPRDIENNIKIIQNRLREAHHNPGGFMSVEDADQFHRIFEDMRMEIRRLPNY